MPLPELIQYIAADAAEERNCEIYERAEALEHCPFLTNDECSVCKVEGDLIICDSCPQTFHKQCCGQTQTSEDDFFYCRSCRRD